MLKIFVRCAHRYKIYTFYEHISWAQLPSSHSSICASIFKLTTSKNMKFHEARYASLSLSFRFARQFLYLVFLKYYFLLFCGARRNFFFWLSKEKKSLMHLTWRVWAFVVHIGCTQISSILFLSSHSEVALIYYSIFFLLFLSGECNTRVVLLKSAEMNFTKIWNIVYILSERKIKEREREISPATMKSVWRMSGAMEWSKNKKR